MQKGKVGNGSVTNHGNNSSLKPKCSSFKENASPVPELPP